MHPLEHVHAQQAQHCAGSRALSPHPGMLAEPKVLSAEEIPTLKWTAADEEGIVTFLVGEKNFSEDRVRKAVEKLNASRNKANQGAWPSLLSHSAFERHTRTLTALMRTVHCRAPCRGDA